LWVWRNKGERKKGEKKIKNRKINKKTKKSKATKSGFVRGKKVKKETGRGDEQRKGRGQPVKMGNAS